MSQPIRLQVSADVASQLLDYGFERANRTRGTDPDTVSVILTTVNAVATTGSALVSLLIDMTRIPEFVKALRASKVVAPADDAELTARIRRGGKELSASLTISGTAGPQDSQAIEHFTEAIKAWTR